MKMQANVTSGGEDPSAAPGGSQWGGWGGLGALSGVCGGWSLGLCVFGYLEKYVCILYTKMIVSQPLSF